MAASSKVQLDFSGLVERLVPAVAELFATLGAQDPLKMSFADLASKTVLDMVEVMQRDGISQEAIAATLGMSIGGFRTKLRKLRDVYRTQESGNGSMPKSLLEQVYAFIDQRADATADEKKEVLYAAIAKHFSGIQQDTLRGVLKFLVTYGLLEVKGRGNQRRYHIASRRAVVDSGLAQVSVLLFREGPMPLAQLCARTGLREAACEALLERLRDDGSLEEKQLRGVAHYRVRDYHIPVGMRAGYEAALLDHLTTVFAAVCKKVRLGRHEASLADLHGGTTFSFDVPVGHALEAELSGFLAQNRARMEDWLRRAKEAERADPEAPRRRITIYTGQMVEDL